MDRLPDDLLARFAALIGVGNVLTGADAAPYGTDWTRAYVSRPMAVLRPGSTAEVAGVVRLCAEAGIALVPLSGRTGLSGGGMADGAVAISLERMNRIRRIKPESRVMIAEAGAVLSALHAKAEEHGLSFPLTFGAKGSAMIGGCLATNAGGSNVLRYGNARALCLGIEVVLASGEVLDLMSELRKDNTGYDLRDLFIGSEGTLGIITAAVLKLEPAPLAYATAMVAASDLDAALRVLNGLQEATGGAVEAFEFMPALYIEEHLKKFPNARPPFETRHEINLLVEIGATTPREASARNDGSLPLNDRLEVALAEAMERGDVTDAVIARSVAERREMWARREAAAEVALSRQPIVNIDIAVPLDRVADFLERMREELPRLDPDAKVFTFAHLGDGNIHYTVWPSRDDAGLVSRIALRTDAVAVDLGGTFSAEHGIGIAKLEAMAELKNPVALEVMRRIKQALDPKGIMNPGKVLPG